MTNRATADAHPSVRRDHPGSRILGSRIETQVFRSSGYQRFEQHHLQENE
jgi:hypothetical protein